MDGKGVVGQHFYNETVKGVHYFQTIGIYISSETQQIPRCGVSQHDGAFPHNKHQVLSFSMKRFRIHGMEDVVQQDGEQNYHT